MSLKHYLILLILLPFILITIRLLVDYKQYKNSFYKNETGLSFLNVRFDKGSYGEFLSYAYLEDLKGFSKTLVNLYIPRENTTTEIDLVFLHETGIYVIESKNYIGWIYGNDNHKQWTQTFKNGSKYKFYNPIFQNNMHIKYLKKLLPSINEGHFNSIIVFSERCTLKKIIRNINEIPVIKRNKLFKTIKEISEKKETVFSKEEIKNIYKILKKYSNVSESVKNEHIENIKRKEN